MSRLAGVRFAEPGPDLTARRVSEAFPDTPGLYVHVPFCRTLCPFCPYNKVPYRADLAADYVDHLEREASQYLDALPGPFPSLYVGGGTPTLCLDGLAPLLARLPVTGERAIEVLPLHMTEAGARQLTDLGFDFVSLGVQSFDPTVLRRLHRPGSPAANRSAIETALGRFSCVDVDLIFDAAYDDPRILLRDLAVCFDLGVDQVSTYPLMRFGFTPFGKGQHDRRREHALLREATGLAEASGYERRSVWTFNRAGAPAYTSITRPYFLGLGAGAATFAGRLFAVNHFGLAQYRDALDAGRLPIAEVAHLTRPAASAYRVFWQAYTGSIPADTSDPLLRTPVAAFARGAARALGLAHRVDGGLRLTPSGYDRYHDLERWVTYHLIEPLWTEMMEEHRTAPEPIPAGGAP
jgi:oxygen-independent coproporphyrinogen-3 oxidase